MIDRKPNREITDQEELQYVLERSKILRLGLCADNEPYVVPMNYGIGEGCLYLHSSQKGKKADMLRANPRVCFEMETDVALIEADAPCGFTMRFRSIVGYGTAAFLENAEEKLAGLKIIMAHYSDTTFKDGDFLEKALAKTAVIRLDIESMRGAKHGWNG
ncbi:pyridoxamine 5'-phosphate oxidase family protein [Desulfovibrio ferrophilus]|uniref:Pyridoxamine 5'-phosphate oxidase-related FMN-binding n=1 Tax=Desulfovibrio ferrophilus TaxID=241368 RepID=A0A2Z6B2R5_9BACT|nr:pyridoxamine 5'-phosphate oxidase family protein [Desulfovibrio ferrophilus]BBD09781.1 pyridoxamine 5'-phosphate oxidase-related FMN-binding [Desulfovibrio ferrophilus]